MFVRAPVCVLVWSRSISERLLSWWVLAVEVWGGGGGGETGSLHPDYRSLINSPGHVVYIFRCEVEGLYLWVARFESAERERISLKRKTQDI